MLYYGTGNPSTWNPSQQPGDNRWSISIWARDLNFGRVKWVFQMTPFDECDYDDINEMILADIPHKGKVRKALVHFDRNGFGYTLDRVTGELLMAEKFDPAVNWATYVDMKSGRLQVVTKKNQLIKQAIPYPTLNADPAQYPGEIIERDLAAGKLNAAIVWGPLEGYFVSRVTPN